MVKINQKALTDILLFAILMVSLIIVNQLAENTFFRWDLTEEKRYSISPATKSLLNGLEEPVFIEVFLEGDMPSEFKRLQKSIRERLDEFVVYSRGKVQYTFVDPNQAKSGRSKNEFFMALAEKGVQPTNLSYTRDGKKTEKWIFPGAVLSYGTEELGILLLKGDKQAGPEQILNQSIENIEYEFASAISALKQEKKARIGVINNYGMLDSLELHSFYSVLNEKYEAQGFNLESAPLTSLDYGLVILNKPTQALSESAKYKLDQYLMQGGRLMIFNDVLRVNMDSAGGEGTIAVPFDQNLDDMLFKYGVRINKNLVQDLNSGDYPVVAGSMGDQSQLRMLPWPFFPLVNNFSPHPMVRNLDAISFKFVSTIDTVKADGVLKTPLMFSSAYSRIRESPVRVAFNEIREGMDPKQFNQGPYPLGWLLEGRFTSLYKNRFLPDGFEKADHLDDSRNTKVLVVADGDLVRNDLNQKSGQPTEMGYDQFNQISYGNKDFLINALEYMLDEDGIINARKKEIKIRPLDKIKVQEEKLKWQVINLLSPAVLILLLGLCWQGIRKRRFSSFGNKK